MPGNDPVVIGGVGGSGTRLIAQILKDLGYNMGHDLNKENDNLSFTLLFRRIPALSLSFDEFQDLINIVKIGILGHQKFTPKQLHTIQSLGECSRPFVTTEWSKIRANNLINTAIHPNTNPYWGWKEPNSQLFLPQLHQAFPQMRYIHVMRNGMDMAFSENQNQLKLWGKHVLNQDQDQDMAITPANSLKYWCVVQQKIFAYSKNLKHNFHLINFDQLCQQPDKVLPLLLDFLNHSTTDEQQLSLRQLIQQPQSIGRYKHNDITQFDPQDIAFVKNLGFDVAS